MTRLERGIDFFLTEVFDGEIYSQTKDHLFPSCGPDVHTQDGKDRAVLESCFAIMLVQQAQG